MNLHCYLPGSRQTGRRRLHFNVPGPSTRQALRREYRYVRRIRRLNRLDARWYMLGYIAGVTGGCTLVEEVPG